MPLETKVHPIQSDVLKKLLFRKQARFSELKPRTIGSDQFTFHIKQLIRHGLVEKVDSSYSLTVAGKDYANNMDVRERSAIRQPRLNVVLVVSKKIDGETKYLMQKRQKHPFYGHLAFPSGKLKWGQPILESAQDELKRETNLTGEPILSGVLHRIDHNDDGDAVTDNVLIVIKFRKVSGELATHFAGGNNLWMSRQAVQEHDKLVSMMRTVLDHLVDKTGIQFLEETFQAGSDVY